MEAYIKKYSNLIAKMEEFTKEDIAVAFSGGVDSSLLLKTACRAAEKSNKKVYAVTVNTTLHTLNDIEISKKVAEEFKAEHIIINIDEIQNAGIIDNPIDRCYRCKKYLFTEIKNEMQKLGVKTIIEGTNSDDLKEYRPGIKAIKELQIISPLAETEFTKHEIRQLAEELNISVSNRPSTPCLATRFPYGTTLNYKNIKKVETAENFLKNFDLYNVRLRIHGNIARLEVDEKDILKVIEHRKEIIDFLKNLDYYYITLDLEGFRSGSMDIF